MEHCQDVLVYATPVLCEEMQAIGPVSIKLYAKTEARDTDMHWRSFQKEQVDG